MNNFTKTNIYSSKPIPDDLIPNNILMIRLHSIGDVAITLPYCMTLKIMFPSTNIDFLASENISTLPASLDIFKNIFQIEIENNNNSILNKIKKYYRAYKLSSLLKKRNYDLVIDLQNNKLSRLLRKKISPLYYSEFDRFSPIPAATRVQNTILNTGIKNIYPEYKIKLKTEILVNAKNILLQNGWDKTKKIFILNPAGLWITRNWLIENYVSLAKIISSNYNAVFLLLGTERMMEKAKYISSYLGKNVINLVNKTTLPESFALLSFASAIISEDSGLMHMAWALGISNVVLLGSSRADWTSPIGEYTICLNSSDLECGNCMTPQCKYHDVHCLIRYTPEFVFEKLQSLLKKLAEKNYNDRSFYL